MSERVSIRAAVRFCSRAITTVLLAAAPVVQGCGDAPTSTPVVEATPVNGVYPAGSHPFGKSYGEWGAAYWQWVCSTPVTDANDKLLHPMWDSAGTLTDAGFGQDPASPVFFLMTPYGQDGATYRTVSVPVGKAILVPVLNVRSDNVLSSRPKTVEQHRKVVASVMDNAQDLLLEVDGLSVPNIKSFRALSPVFSFVVPERNIYAYYDPTPVPEGTTVDPVIDDGYYVMLAPLPPGTHIIHLTGRYAGYPWKKEMFCTIEVR